MKERRRGYSIERALPFVSIVLPVRNESAFIARSVRAVLTQDYPSDRYEIIVADGMSSDNTRRIVESFGDEEPNVRLVDNPGRIAPTGLNAAIATARGQIIARVDGHCEIAPDYIRNSVGHLMTDGVDAVGGPLETIGETHTARVIAAAMSSTFGVGDSAFRTKQNETQLTDTIAFPVYTREIISAAGAFDEELVRNQDDEYNYRLRKIGAQILLAADVRSRYYSRGSLRSLWRQYFQYGYWKVRVMQKHPLQMRPRQFVPLVFVLALLLGVMLTPFSYLAALFLLIVLSAYAGANLIASFRVASRNGWELLPLLPAAFVVLHISFGVGFLIGLIKFWNRWFDPATSKPMKFNAENSPRV